MGVAERQRFAAALQVKWRFTAPGSLAKARSPSLRYQEKDDGILPICFLPASCLGSLACDFGFVPTSPARSRRPVSAWSLRCGLRSCLTAPSLRFRRFDPAPRDVTTVNHWQCLLAIQTLEMMERFSPILRFVSRMRRAASLRFHATGLAHAAAIQAAVPSARVLYVARGGFVPKVATHFVCVAQIADALRGRAVYCMAASCRGLRCTSCASHSSLKRR